MKKSLYKKIGIEYVVGNYAGNTAICFLDLNGLDPIFSEIKNDKKNKYDTLTEESIKTVTGFTGFLYKGEIKLTGSIEGCIVSEVFALIDDQIHIKLDLFKAALDFVGIGYEIYTQQDKLRAIKLVNGSKEVVVMPYKI